MEKSKLVAWLQPACERVVLPIVRNIPLLLLSWALIATIGVVAADPTCKSLPLGDAEFFVYGALGFGWKSIVFGLTCFFLLPAFVYGVSGKGHRTEELEAKFFRPIAVPLLFQIAGLLGGFTSLRPERGIWSGLVVASCIVIMALVLYNVAYCFTPRKS